MSEKIINIERIIEMLPHRYPLLLVDRVLNIEKGRNISAIKNVTFNEPHFTGHFPGHPIMPGVLIIEALAQTSALLVVETLGAEAEGSLVYFTTIDGARFRKPVIPGDILHLKAEVLQNKKNLWKLEVKAEVEGKIAAEATISAMIMGKPD